jgi:hypothetical protein
MSKREQKVDNWVSIVATLTPIVPQWEDLAPKELNAQICFNFETYQLYRGTMRSIVATMASKAQ